MMFIYVFCLVLWDIGFALILNKLSLSSERWSNSLFFFPLRRHQLNLKIIISFHFMLPHSSFFFVFFYYYYWQDSNVLASPFKLYLTQSCHITKIQFCNFWMQTFILFFEIGIFWWTRFFFNSLKLIRKGVRNMLGERVLYCLLVQFSKEKANRGNGNWIEILEQCRQKIQKHWAVITASLWVLTRGYMDDILHKEKGWVWKQR
jgi:hypothetical protein